jgi:hypothetical protein
MIAITTIINKPITTWMARRPIGDIPNSVWLALTTYDGNAGCSGPRMGRCSESGAKEMLSARGNDRSCSSGR